MIVMSRDYNHLTLASKWKQNPNIQFELNNI